jgi:hypothetical protein
MRNGNKKRGNKRDTYNRSLHVLAQIRRTGMTLTAAARENHIDPRTVRKYLGTDLKRNGIPSKSDRRRRDMLVPTSRGTTPVAVRGSSEASQLGRYMSSVGDYLRTGNTEGLDEFKGKSIGGHRLITDPDALDSLAQAGSLQLDEIYALPGSSS